MENYSAIKMNKLLIHKTAWMNVKSIMLIIDHILMIPFTWHSGKHKTICTKIYQWFGGGEELQMDIGKFWVVTIHYTFVKIHIAVLVNMSEFYYM